MSQYAQGRALAGCAYQSHDGFVAAKRAVEAAFAKIWNAHIAKTVAKAVPRPRSGTIPTQSGCAVRGVQQFLGNKHSPYA